MPNSTTILGIIEMRLKGISYDDCRNRYGTTDGLWGRWASYVATGGHGGNKMMVKAIKEDPERCHNLQFSVLQILPKTLTWDKVIAAETLWKEKLLTKQFGWNEN